MLEEGPSERLLSCSLGVMLLILSYALLQESGFYLQAPSGARLFILSRVSREELSAKRLCEVSCMVATHTQAPPPSPRSREALERVDGRAPLERKQGTQRANARADVQGLLVTSKLILLLNW